MTKKIRFLSSCLLLLLLSINAAHAQEALNVHRTDGASPVSIQLDKILRITFSDNDMTVKQTDGVVSYALDNIAKLTFGNVIISGIGAPPVSNAFDVLVYSLSPGEIRVESSAAIRRLALFAIDGKKMYADDAVQTTINISAFPPGIYLLQIETQQGTAVKKIIKK